MESRIKGGETMGRVLRIMAGLVFGAVVGAGLVMLLAPRSGAETRRLIQERVDAVLAEGRRAAEERRLELTAHLEALKET
jgi:gas vesicle protein